MTADSPKLENRLVYKTNIQMELCPEEPIDPTIIHCDNENCKWSESFTEEIVYIAGNPYYTWRPKGIIDDDCGGVQDPGIHFHLSCGEDSLGVRLSAVDIIETLRLICDQEIIDRFCQWMFDNCLNSDALMDWLCETILDYCFESESFAETLCEWFEESVLTSEKFLSSFTTWFQINILDDSNLADRFCQIFEECLDTEIAIDKICDIAERCIEENQLVKDEICGILEECFSDQDVQDKICGVISDRCDLVCEYGNDSPDPSGQSADCWFLVKIETGKITHINVDGIWACVVTDPAPPTNIPVLLDLFTSCPLAAPFNYKNNLMNSLTDLENELTAEYGCPVTYNASNCTMSFPAECAEAPSYIDVASV